jgi:hypothetical protein
MASDNHHCGACSKRCRADMDVCHEAACAPARTWSEPEIVASVDGRARPPLVVAAGEDVAFAFWRRDRSDVLWTARRSDGAWTEPGQLGTGEGKMYDATAAVDARGNAYAVWSQGRSGRSTIRGRQFRVTQAGGAWGDPMPISAGDGFATSPDVVQDAMGNYTIVWREKPAAGGDGNIRARRVAADGTWTDVVTLEDQDGQAHHPQLAADPAGNVHAVWTTKGLEIDVGLGDVWTSRFDAASGAWGEAIALESKRPESHGPRIGTDANGGAVVVWSEGNLDRSIYGRTYDPGTKTWSDPQRLGMKERVNAQLPRLAVAPNGNAIVVWQQHLRKHVLLNEYNAKDDRWAGPMLVPGSAEQSEYPDVAVDSSGNAIVVWHHGLDQRRVHAAQYWAKEDEWVDGVPIDGATRKANASYPSVAVDARGDGFVVWASHGPGHDEIRVATLRPRTSGARVGVLSALPDP